VYGYSRPNAIQTTFHRRAAVNSLHSTSDKDQALSTRILLSEPALSLVPGEHVPAAADMFALTVPFAAIDRTSLALVGGKGANLGELTRAGFPVPGGFCVTTAAYRAVAREAGIETLLAALAEVQPGDTGRLAALAGRLRERLLTAPVPQPLADAVVQSYRAL